MAWWRVARGRNRRRVDRTADAALAARRARRVVRAATGAALLLGAGVGGVYGWRALVRSESLRIRELRFEGLGHATADELTALSPVRIGDHLLFADLSAVRTSLARHPWVRSVEARRSWPPAIVIAIHERTPAALVDLGGLYLVDDDGNVFKRAAAGDGLDLPVITGIARGEYVQRRATVEPVLRAALALARAWREGGRDATTRLSEIHVDPGEGTTIYIGDEGTQVRLGSGDLSVKLARLEKVLSALRAEGRKAEVLHLDNRVHPSWVTVRLASSEQAKGGGR